ncbi:MAG: radical SAM protein [Oscillospiraceae bacterium]|nr:radical SAM protein [Oscillospiraceae bacterium]
MHFTDTVYRNPYWPTFPLLQITQGCTHNSCKFCTMYQGVPFKLQPMEWIEEDLKELSEIVPDAKTIQLLSANPLCMTYDKLAPILELINKYLPQMEYIYACTRVTDIRNKTVEQLKALKQLGLREISLGSESGDDWTLKRVNKKCSAQDILEQCEKLTEAGIAFWLTFLNGVAGKEHSMDHAIHSAELFSRCKPMLVGTGGLTLFPGTPLLDEAERGLFTPLTEKEMLLELKVFVEHLTCDCYFNTHHTSGIHLSGPDFLKRKNQIIEALDHEIRYGDMDRLATVRKNKRTL